MKISRRFKIMFNEGSICQIDDRFLKVEIWLMHLGKNKNWSVFEKEVVEKALPTLYNIPILGFIKADPDTKELDFAGHEEELVYRDDTGYEWRYLGSAYGVIPESCNPRWQTRLCDDGATREFLVVDGLMWNKFKTATDIIKAHNGCQGHSMEICQDYEGDWNDDYDFVFSDFRFEGACILGVDVEPAMHNSTVEVKFANSDKKIDIQSYLDEYAKITNNKDNKEEDITPEQFSTLSTMLGEVNKEFQAQTIFQELSKLNQITAFKN